MARRVCADRHWNADLRSDRGYKCFAVPPWRSINLEAVRSNGYSFRLRCAQNLATGGKIAESADRFYSRFQGIQDVIENRAELFGLVWRLIIAKQLRRSPRTNSENKP